MEQSTNQIKIRDLRDGDWYWIHRAVIRDYVPKMGSIGLVVYNFLASLADSSQHCFPSQKYMAGCIGYSRATINKTIKRLERIGLIKIQKRDRYHCVYSLLKVRCKAGETQMSTGGNSDVKYFDTNDNKITRINNDIDRLKINKLKSMTFKGFEPKTKEELLALDLAQGLNDFPGLPLYLSLAKKYPEALLRMTLSEVKGIPAKNIKKSRGALFNYLIQKHA
ncbi:MAG: helix-turn-helix domain-containing protein [Deltaproteobacteria bacterium]|nr:helix-turn-helix domain-containing protein [Deltaproteobacteria bacterium]